MNTEHMTALGVALDSEPVGLLAASRSAIAVVGIAGLGEEIEWHDNGDMDLGEVEVAGLSAADGLMALECRGDSMRPRVNDRELVVARRRDGKTPGDLVGREAIVKVSDGPVLLKRIRRGYEPGRWNLESYNADLRENVAIEWVAELVSIIPEGAWRRA
jgi:phage repressor protein C with HTH and peptisase S24 domain